MTSGGRTRSSPDEPKRIKRRLLRTTTRLDTPIAIAATRGSSSPAAASGNAEMLYPIAQPRFSRMFATVERARPTAAGTPSRSFPMRAMPLFASAASVPLPIAHPTSAAARAGASLIPSPTITTRCPSCLQLPDRFDLLRGAQPVARVVDAELRRNRPDRWRRVAAQHDRSQAHRTEMRNRGDGLAPKRGVHRDHADHGTVLLHATTVSPLSAKFETALSIPSGKLRRVELHHLDDLAVDNSGHACPGELLRVGRTGPPTLRAAVFVAVSAAAASRIASAIGCELSASTTAARASTTSRVFPGAGTIPVTVAVLSVRVPVLSNTTVSTLESASSVSPPRTRIPSADARPQPTMIATGVAKPHRARARDQQESYPAQHRLSEVAGEQPPAEERDKGCQKHDRYEHRADPIGDPLHRCLLALRVVDETLEVRQHRLGRDHVDPDDEDAVSVSCASDHGVTRSGGQRGTAHR